MSLPSWSTFWDPEWRGLVVKVGPANWLTQLLLFVHFQLPETSFQSVSEVVTRISIKAADGQRYDLNIDISQGRDGCLDCVLPRTLSCMRIKPWKSNNIRFDNLFYATLTLVTWMIIDIHCFRTKNIRLILTMFWVKYKLGIVFDDLPIIVTRKSSISCHTEKHCFLCIYSQHKYVVLFS